MSREPLNTSFGKNRPQDTSVVKVLVVYEDLKTGLRGKTMMVDLQELWHPEPEFSDSLWHGNLLRDPLFREQAAMEACQADLILLSVHGRNELSPELRDWWGRWLDQKENRPYAICVLLDRDIDLADDQNPVLSYMSHLAKEAEVDLCTTFASLQLLGSKLRHEEPVSTPPPAFPCQKKERKNERTECLPTH